MIFLVALADEIVKAMSKYDFLTVANLPWYATNFVNIKKKRNTNFCI